MYAWPPTRSRWDSPVHTTLDQAIVGLLELRRGNVPGDTTG
jgi:hypothetical protein